MANTTYGTDDHWLKSIRFLLIADHLHCSHHRDEHRCKCLLGLF